jgi:hypothetical protein
MECDIKDTCLGMKIKPILVLSTKGYRAITS